MNNTTNQQTAEFGDALAVIAIRAANAYLETHKLSADKSALAACISSWLRIKLPEAIQDAKAAYDCGMEAIGKQTFAATIAQAGIEAAKECSFPKS